MKIVCIFESRVSPVYRGELFTALISEGMSSNITRDPSSTLKRQHVTVCVWPAETYFGPRLFLLASLFDRRTGSAWAGHHICLHGPVYIVCRVMAHQDAAVGAPVVGDRCTLILCNHIDVKIH